MRRSSMACVGIARIICIKCDRQVVSNDLPNFKRRFIYVHLCSLELFEFLLHFFEEHFAAHSRTHAMFALCAFEPRAISYTVKQLKSGT